MTDSPSRPLVWLGEVPWRGLPQRQHHLIRGLHAGWDVLYVEPPPSLRPPSFAIVAANGVRIAQVAPILNARQPVLQRLLQPVATRALAARLAVAQVRRAVRRAWPRAPRGGVWVVCSNIYLARAARALRPARLVLDVCDDPRAFPNVPPWTADLLRDSVWLADVVTTSSRALERELSSMRPQADVRYVPNGVRADLLTAASRTPAGSIGYLGYLGPWLDFELLEAAADALPERSFELVGPVDPSVASSMQRLLRRPNVCLRPPVAEAEVRRVLSGFGVGIIPFVCSPLTMAVNPNKLYEYAALDMPVVTTRFSPDLEPFASSIDVCPTPAAFVETLRQRANGLGLRSTRWIAETHTWQAIAAEFAGLLEG